MEKIMIEDTEYSYDPEREYIKDGHAYCKNCHERKDGKVMEFFGNKKPRIPKTLLNQRF